MGTDVGRADPGAPGVDLSHCEREPVHIPGAVQPHGALLVLDPSELRIVAASDNTERILGLVADRLIGLGLPEISDTAEHRALVESLRRPNPTDRNPHPWTLAGGRGFDVVAHVHDGRLLVEFEPRGPDPRFAHIERDVLAGLGRLHAASSLQDLCERTAREMRRLTGFDRVLIYAFEADGVGEVVAEESHDGQTRYLGLRFPASDIPSQARALYSACRLRMIPSSSYAPSKVIGLDGERPLDLTHAVLRSISPVHLEYMRNMGVTASLGISLMREGRLWGLITCNHESGDLSLPHPARAALALLGEVVSTWIVAKEETHGEARAAFLHVQSELVQRVLQGRDVVGGLTRQSPSILDVAHCGGAALRYENEIHVVGATPPASAIDALLAWIETQDTQTFVSHSLPAQYAPALAWKDLACGVIATSISFGESSIVRQRIWLIWCRPEVVRTVSWAGDPTKSAPSAPGERLSPRTSFERWKQDVHLESVPFAPPDVDAARSLASALVDVILEIEAGRRIRESASLLGSAHRSLQLREASLQLVLDSIGEGIIAVGLDGCLMSERSRAVEQWFAKASDGAQIWDVLFADGAARDYFRASWDQLVEEVLPFELAVDQMPHSITHDDRSFELDFKDVRVGGALVSVLLRIQDVTERVAARKRALEADEAHSVLAMVLRDARGFARSLVELDALLEAVRSAAAPADARRALHTLKGSAAVLGLRALAQRCHELEDRLAAPGPRGAVSDPDVGAIEDELARIHDRIDELVGKDGLQRVDIPMAELTDVIATAEHGGELTAVLAQLRRWTLEPVTRQLGNLAERARQLSQNLGKRVEVRVVGGDVRVDADRFEPLWAALAHAVANAVDHGIESITVRDECGKDVCGHIVISVEADQQRLTISVADDGGGVDLEATRVVARRRGLPSATRRELLDALFADELSTRRGVTSTSGRGVGLAALRTTCARLGGTVEIDSEPGLGTTLQVQLPIAALPS